MTTTELLQVRLNNQLLSGNGMKEPHEIVAYMGAMQSQAFDMSRWAIGVRLPGTTDQTVIDAINTAKIIRTHILRSTWHFVAAEDIYWMLDLSGPHLRSTYSSFAKILGMDHTAYSRIWPSMERILRDGNHLTRQELISRLQAEGLPVDTDTVEVVLGFAESDGLICNGRIEGNKQTFCLLQERIPKKQTLTKEESLEKLARKSFTSHGPATIHDFTWWSGLLSTQAKVAFGLIKEDFVSEVINGKEFWMKNDIKIPEKTEDSFLLLPQFDEMVVSYKDRGEMIEGEHYGKVMTKNGIFYPTIILNGKIIGSWRKTTKKGEPEVKFSFFKKATKKTQDSCKKALKTYLDFLV